MGMMRGTEAIPAKWTDVMNDTLHTSMRGYPTTRISKLAEEMFQIHDKMAHGHK